MVKISNKTNRVVVIYNDIFSINIDVGATVEIDDEVLNKNHEFFVRYLSLKQVYKETEFDYKKRPLSNARYFHFEIKTFIPVITVLNLKDVSDVELKEDDILLRAFFLVKTVYLKRIACKCDQTEPENTKCLFLNHEDKTKFLKMMRIGNIISLPIAVLATFLLILSLFYESDIMYKIMISLFLFVVSIIGFNDVYYTAKAKKWDVADKI